MTKKAILYVRVSTDEQKETGYGLTGQFNECVEYAGRLGYQIVGATSHKAIGGKLVESTDADAIPAYVEDFTGFSRFDDRPTGKLVMATLKEHRADAIIIARVDRIARDSLEARIAVHTWLKLGVELHTAKNGRITNDNDIVFLIETWQGQEDYTKIVKNMRDGRNNKARGGKVVGTARPPYGYRFIKDIHGKTVGMEIYEPEAKIVRMMYQWYVKGDESGKTLTLSSTAARLSRMGIFSPRQNIKRVFSQSAWSNNTARIILSNETYCGVWHYRKVDRQGSKVNYRDMAERIAVNVPAIIDRELWEQAQARRTYNYKMALRNCKNENQYLLRGRIRCGCGRTMSGWNGGIGKTIRLYYVCNLRRKQFITGEKICNQKQVRCDKLDAFVWESIKELFSDLDRLWNELKKAQQKELEQQDPVREELRDIDDMIPQAETEVDRIARALRHADDDEGVYKSLKRDEREANAHLKECHAKRDRVIAKLGTRKLTDEAIEDIMLYARDAREGINEANFETKRRLFELLDVQVTVKGTEAQISCVIENCNSQYTSSA